MSLRLDKFRKELTKQYPNQYTNTWIKNLTNKETMLIIVVGNVCIVSSVFETIKDCFAELSLALIRENIK
jgi:late competence protein required for DNA uptake (superfamily II DNA/RNA helicase)